MAGKIVGLILALSCSAFAAPKVYQATGVEHLEAARADDIARVTSEILPEITSAFQELSNAQARANPSDPASIENTLSAFIPLSRKVLQATAKAEGRTVAPEQLERLNAAERMMPTIFKFMNEMRGMTFASGASVPATRSATNSEVPNLATGTLTPDSGNYRGMAAATMELLPELGTIFAQIGNDPGRSDPSDPDYVQRVVTAFMPFTKRALLAAAKAEGRVVQQEELDRLDAAEAVMPTVFKFMDTLRESDFFGTHTNTALRSLTTLPTAFDPPKPSSLTLEPAISLFKTAQVLDPAASQSSFKDRTPAAPSRSVFPSSTSPLHSSPIIPYTSPVIYQSVPNYSEVSHVPMPQVYQAYIPSVPSANPGLTYYTYSTSLGRREIV